MKKFLAFLLVTIFCKNYAWDGNYYQRQNYKQLRSAYKLLTEIDLGHCQKIADLGCGTGEVTAWIAQNTKAQVVGFDYSESMIKKAKENFGHIENISFAVLDIRDWPFGANEFDAIVSFSVLHWIKEIDKVIASIADSLKKGGIFAAVKGHTDHFMYQPILKVANTKEWFNYFENPNAKPWYAHTSNEFEQIVIEYGLTPKSIYTWYKVSEYKNKEQLVDWLMGWLIGTPQLKQLPSNLRIQFVKEVVDEHLKNNLPKADGSITIVSPLLMIHAMKE